MSESGSPKKTVVNESIEKVSEDPQSKQDVAKMAKEFMEAQNKTIVEMQRKQDALMEQLGIDLEGDYPLRKKRKRDYYEEGAYSSTQDYRDYDPERRSATHHDRDYDPNRRSASRTREEIRRRDDVPRGRSAHQQAEDVRRGRRSHSPRVEHPPQS